MKAPTKNQAPASIMRLLAPLAFLALAMPACSSEAPTPTPAPTAAPASAPTTAAHASASFEGVRGVVDPENLGWPREVEGLNGVVKVHAKPQRIITASVGHDEMTLALAPPSRLVGVGAATKDATYSNVADLTQDITVITRDPETIIAQKPDVVVTSPYFPADAVDALTRAGIPVIQTALEHDPEALIDTILFMGYVLGEEQRAFEFAAEARRRYEALATAVTGAAERRPRVLALTQYSDNIWTAGGNSTEGSVILAAGGINAAEEAGIESNQTTSLEGVIAMRPEVIIIPQPAEYGAAEFRQSLLDNEALSETPAIRDARVHIVESRRFTTLSYWNILGAEQLARMLWPDAFPDALPPPFSLPE